MLSLLRDVAECLEEKKGSIALEEFLLLVED